MESVGAFPCGEIDSFAVSDFLDHSLFNGGHGDAFSPSLEAENGVSTTLNESVVRSNHNHETNLSLVSQQCSYYRHVEADQNMNFLSGFNQIPWHIDMFMGIANPHVEANALALAKEMPLKRKLDEPEKNPFDPSENISNNKRIRGSRDVGSEGQSSCSYSSEEEKVGQETKQCMAMNSNRKARAARGGATDPQSLYARKRRERINERLKTLQNLVPNGTKVDISTMLEEAVHYVKFLQLQIKLLSSDDLWMYAPLAYNGFDMGLHMKIFSQFTRQ